MLQHLLDSGSTLIDYERIADEQNRRLIFFSVHAGYAGMIESLVCLAQRMAVSRASRPRCWSSSTPTNTAAWTRPRTTCVQIGAAHPGRGIGGPHRADGHRRGRLRQRGQGLPGDPGLPAGHGDPRRGPGGRAGTTAARPVPWSRSSSRKRTWSSPGPTDAQFVLQDYYQRPENYRGIFAEHLPHLDVLMNTIYWEDQYPRLVTRKWAQAHYGPDKRPRLQVIGDISCDIEGSIELTLKAPMPDQPCFVFDPADGQGPSTGWRATGR